MSAYNRLVFGEGGERWSIIDPTSERSGEVLHKARYGGELTQGERYVLAELGGAFRFLCTYELGVECVVKKLRQIRRELGTNR